jgi:hypothetical protein
MRTLACADTAVCSAAVLLTCCPAHSPHRHQVCQRLQRDEEGQHTDNRACVEHNTVKNCRFSPLTHSNLNSNTV